MSPIRVPRAVARYNCQGSMINHGGPRCISFGAVRIDNRVSEEVLRQLEPLGIGASLEAIERVRSEQDERVRHKELARTRYEAARARRQYDAIEPENRLVAAELERRWEETLQIQARLQAELESMRELSERALSTSERDELLRLWEDLPGLWNLVTKQDDTIRALVHWQGGDHTEIVFEKSHTGEHRWTTDVETIDIVRALARTLPDQAIAAVINRLGKRTARGHTWTAARVCTSRNRHHIATYREGERQERGELTVAEVSGLVGVSGPTIIRLIRVGRLSASQACPGAPWIIRQTDVAAYLARQADSGPQSADPNQLSIDLQ